MTDETVSIIDAMDDVNPNLWNNLVSQSDLGTVFHRHEWLQAVETGFGSEPRHVVVRKDSNPVAVFPNFYDSIQVPVAKNLLSAAPLRELNSIAPGYGGPIVGGNEQERLEKLLDALADLRDTRTLYHWIRTTNLGYVRYGRTLMQRGYTPLTVDCRFRIDLTQSWEEIKDGMESDYLRRLRQMEDHDVEYRDEPITEQAIEEFYAAHTRNLERLGSEPYPFAFYEALCDLLADRLKILAVVVDGQEVGQYLYLRNEEQSTLRHYLAGIGDEDHFEYNPSQLLHTHAIQWAKDEGYRYYDFGSTRADYTNGVFRHKANYGGELVPSIQWRKGFSRLGWPAFRTAQTLYRKARS
jgi:hypothetical protein